jgi:hypothetical protein
MLADEIQANPDAIENCQYRHLKMFNFSCKKKEYEQPVFSAARI